MLMLFYMAMSFVCVGFSVVAICAAIVLIMKEMGGPGI